MRLFRSARPVRPRLARWAVVLGGIVALQAVLYAPSLFGGKLLLPLDLLGTPGFYLPAPPPEHPPPEPAPFALSDLVNHWEVARKFAAAEVRAGRLPVWDPYGYCGAPFADFGKYSPFMVPYYLIGSPAALAWVQLLKALVAGVGAYLFFRRVLGARFWPAAAGAWVYPLSGFLMLWRGDPISDAAAWYPALLAAVHVVARRPSGRGVPALAAVTACAVFAGHADVAAQALVGSGLFGLWSVARRAGVRPARWWWPLLGLAVGWGSGLLLSAPYLVPLIEYTKTSQRLALRGAGEQERPPGTWEDLPLVAGPDWYGGHRQGSAWFSPRGVNQIESAAAAYAGLLALFVAAPLAWADRRRRGVNLFLAGTAVVGLVWVLGVPGLVRLLGASGVNLVSHNRLTFWTGFAVLALAVAGLSAAWRGRVRWRWGYAVPVLALAAFAVLAVVRSANPPEVDTAAELSDRAKEIVRERLTATCRGYAALAVAGLAAGGVVFSARRPGLAARVLAAGVVAEAVGFARGLDRQDDPAMDYPRLAALEQIRAGPDGRAIGLFCLPTNFLAANGVRDVRGYDALDPRPVLDVLDRVRAESLDTSPPYARTMSYVPKLTASAAGGLRLPPALDLLGLRAVVTFQRLFPMLPPARPTAGYYVYENPRALPRCFFPVRVEAVGSEADALDRVAAPDFDPRAVAYVVRGPGVPADARGEARVAAEVPARVTVRADTPTGGLLVLADQWADGWAATVSGAAAEVVRVDHAVKGVVVPPGSHEVVFSYRPPGLTRGLALAAVGGVLLAGWAAGGRRQSRRL